MVGDSIIASGFDHAFFSGGALSDHNSLIDPSLGIVLSDGDGINASGQIVANGTIEGQDRAFLLTPEGGGRSAAPEPSTWALIILGLGLTGAVLRRGRAWLTSSAG